MSAPSPDPGILRESLRIPSNWRGSALADRDDYSIAADPAMHLEMQLRPGEINFLKNSTALHARDAYVDFDEPERKRHLLRLWLTAHGEWSDGDAFVQQGIPTRASAGSDALASNAGGRCC